ncbi:MAG: squalene/phytoene synthase family protein [Polyangiales bacterium]
MSAEWEFCVQSLRKVSRTFSRPIEVLPGDLRRAVTCGYLLCRIVDAVEDNSAFSLDDRDERYRAFHAVLSRASAPGEFERLWVGVEGSPDDEVELCTKLSVVTAVLDDVPREMQDAVLRWVIEMARGMQIFSHRRPDGDGVVAPSTPGDLERYCYFVAGTVGQMLTDLFVAEIGVSREGALAGTLYDHAESFGTGLQLVNILKDITDDMHRGWSFVPRSLCRAAGIRNRDLIDPTHLADAHRVVAPLFVVARERLDEALEYALAIPADQREIRLFCLLPLWMAVKTIALAHGNDAMFVAGQHVKVSREDVENVIVRCAATFDDNATLRADYESFWAPVLQDRTQTMDAA